MVKIDNSTISILLLLTIVLSLCQMSATTTAESDSKCCSPNKKEGWIFSCIMGAALAFITSVMFGVNFAQYKGFADNEVNSRTCYYTVYPPNVMTPPPVDATLVTPPCYIPTDVQHYSCTCGYVSMSCTYELGKFRNANLTRCYLKLDHESMESIVPSIVAKADCIQYAKLNETLDCYYGPNSVVLTKVSDVVYYHWFVPLIVLVLAGSYLVIVGTGCLINKCVSKQREKRKLMAELSKELLDDIDSDASEEQSIRTP